MNHRTSRRVAPAAPAPGAGRSADLALERAIEGRFGSEADRLRDAGDAHGMAVEQTGGDLQPPLAQVLDRRNSLVDALRYRAH
jgi:hypothetical protein